MSLATNTSQVSNCSILGKNYIFHDPPILSRSVRLNIIELDKSDKQIVNEFVYRCCRILTRVKTTIESDCRVLIIDTISSINPIRLAMILKRDSARLRQIQIARQCKINSTYVTLCANLKQNDKPISLTPALCVIYHDEFYIMKTLNLLNEVMNKSPRTQFILVLPKIERLSKDALHLMSANQTLLCDFAVSRKDIAPAPPNSNSDSYQQYLNKVTFRRYTNGKLETLEGELKEEGLHLYKEEATKSKQSTKSIPRVKHEFEQPKKKPKTTQNVV